MSTNHIDSNLTHVNSYYAATANGETNYPALQGDIHCDVCVVGAGSAGMSTAIEAAQKGLSVVLVEGVKIGWGASGRNGGQVIGGWNQDSATLTKNHSIEMADLFWEMSEEGKKILFDRIEKYNINCDYRPGYIYTAVKERHLAEIEKYRGYQERRHYSHPTFLLSKEELKNHINTNCYLGGYLDMGNGHLHPLNLMIGEANAATSLSVKIFEHSPVTKIDYGSEVTLHTAQGRIKAKQVALCGNTFLDNLVPTLRSKIMPAGTYIIATENLGEARAKSLMPSDAAACDMNYVLDYFRLSSDHRMLFGGGVTYSGQDPKDIVAMMRPNMIKVFPQLKDVKIDFAWGGMIDLSVNRMPHLGRVTDNVYFMQGFSGHGVIPTRIAGRVMAEVLAGQASRFDMWNKIKHYDFPGGRLFRMPALMLGTAWYRLRDLIN
jgi:glycine/D-amino acid oxidase-like deaminating enzyme